MGDDASKSREGGAKLPGTILPRNASMADYNEPYDSPIEQAFAWIACKRLRGDVVLHKQVPVTTMCGNFRIDLVADAIDGRRIAFECDGKDYHNRRRDEWRDALILDTGRCDVIYRLRGQDLCFRLDDVVYALSVLERPLFSERGIHNALQLASAAVKRVSFHPRWHAYYVDYSPESRDAEIDDPMDDPADDPDVGPDYLYIARHSFDTRSWHADRLLALAEFAKERRGASVEHLIAAWDRVHPSE